MQILRVVLAVLVLGAASVGVQSAGAGVGAAGAGLVAGDDPKIGGGGAG